jgi:hypothetical protein
MPSHVEFVSVSNGIGKEVKCMLELLAIGAAMPVSFVDWVVKLVFAALAFFLVRWLFPKFMAMIHAEPPDPIPVLVAFAVALVVFFVTSAATLGL